MNASIEPQWEAFDTEFWNTSIEVTKEQITYYEDFIRKIYNYKQQKVASRRRWYKHQQENYWCNLTYEEQIKYYEDIISELDYDVFLDLTLYQIRQHMGESDEELNSSIIEARVMQEQYDKRILDYQHKIDVLRKYNKRILDYQHKIDVLRKEAGLSSPENDAGDHAGLNNRYTLTCEEQIQHYEDIIRNIGYYRDWAMELARTLYRVRKNIGYSEECLNSSIIEARVMQEQYNKRILDYQDKIDELRKEAGWFVFSRKQGNVLSLR